LNLADFGRIRVMADRLGVESIDREGPTVVIKFRPQAALDPVRIVALVRSRPDLTLAPPAALRMSLEEVKGGRSRIQTAAPSWWTTRAREGAVKPGFSKEEILRRPQKDPRATGGMFERVGGVLSDLLNEG
jgi:hypothetical protein